MATRPLEFRVGSPDFPLTHNVLTGRPRTSPICYEIKINMNFILLGYRPALGNCCYIYAYAPRFFKG